jgi:DNA-binding transcriptional ArsR family regulator/bacterioferritin-associated ferredoxin
MSDPPDGAEPFAALGDETRLGILIALADGLLERPDEPAMGFSELRRAVGIRDSGNFNYHLDELRGQFVTETGAGYRLSPAGVEVIGGIVAGTYSTADPDADTGIQRQCPTCGEATTATYADGVLRVDCPNDHVFRNHLPPGAVDDRSVSGVVRTMALKTHRDLEMGLGGVCPNCYGRIAWSVDPEDVGDPPEFATRCERCGIGLEVPAALTVAYHPTVAAFYYDNGVRVRETPPWSPAFWDPVETRLEDGPVVVEVAIDYGDDRVSATLDSSLSVTRLDRA